MSYRPASTRDCTVRALGETRADLEVSSAFELAIGADETVRACRVVRVKDRGLEVEFA